MISDNRAEKAITYLAETDKEHARLKAEYYAKESLTKTVLAYEFSSSKSSAQEAKKMDAYASEAYVAHIEALKTLQIDLQQMYNKRDTEKIVVDMWRTQAANLRKGNI